MARAFGLGRGKVFPDRVLEIGCGPGYFSREIAAAVPDGSLVLFDLQAEMLDLARNRLLAFENIQFTQGDASSLPFSDASSDSVLLVLVLGEVPDRERCIGEVARVLRPGGSVTFAESRRDSDFIPINKLKILAQNRGLNLAEKRGFGWEYAARFEKQHLLSGLHESPWMRANASFGQIR